MLGAVSFKAGERDCKCAFTTSAMCAYEDKHDEPFLSLVEKFDGDGLSNLRVSFLVDLFGIAMRACEPDLEDDDIAKVADEIGPKQVITLIGEAIRGAFPEEAAGGKKPKPGQAQKTAKK